MACVHVPTFGYRMWYAGNEGCFDSKWFGALAMLIVLCLSPLYPMSQLWRLDPMSRYEAAMKVCLFPPNRYILFVVCS